MYSTINILVNFKYDCTISIQLEKCINGKLLKEIEKERTELKSLAFDYEKLLKSDLKKEVTAYFIDGRDEVTDKPLPGHYFVG